MQFLIKLLLLLAGSLAAASPAHADWLRAESQNFVVYAEDSEADLRKTVAELEDYAQLLRTLTRTEAAPSPNKLTIYLVRGSGELQLVRDLPREAAGVYISGADGIAAVANVTARNAAPMTVLFHEYAHHFMSQHHGRAYPAWYVEGFAEYMMTARFTGGSVEYGHTDANRARTLSDTARWLPMEQVLFGRERPAATYGQYYAQSWLLTHYLLTDPQRLQQFRAYLAALGRAEDPRAAFQASFGITPDQLERQLRTYAFGGLTFMRQPRASAAAPPAVRIERLPASAEDLLLLHAAMQVGLRDEGGRLARIRSAAARHDDAFSRRVIAQAEALYGEAAADDRMLDTLLAASPNDAELMYFRGMRYLRAARAAEGEAARPLYRQARTWFSRAHRTAPNHYQTPYRYVQTFTGEPNLVSAGNLEVLLLAHTLAPQVGEIRMAAARMLLALGDFDLAESLLAPLAGTAHEGPQTAVARELLAKARARTNEGTATIF